MRNTNQQVALLRRNSNNNNMSRTERNAWTARHLNVTHPRVTGSGGEPRPADAANARTGPADPNGRTLVADAQSNRAAASPHVGAAAAERPVNGPAAGQRLPAAGSAPHHAGDVLGRRNPGSALSLGDLTAIQARSNEMMALGLAHGSTDIIVNSAPDTTYDFEIFEADWRAAGGTGEVPRYGYIRRDGRPCIWGQPESPQEYRAMRAARAGAEAAENPRARTQPAVDPHARTQPAVDPHARTQPAVDPHARTQPAPAPHLPGVEVEAPASTLRTAAGRVMHVAAGVASAALNARQAYEGINQVRAATRQGTPDAVNQATEGVLNTAGGVLGAVGDVAGLAGAESVAATAGSAAIPLAAATTVIGADRMGNALARDAGVLGTRAGTARTRGVAQPGEEAENPAEDGVNQDFDDAAIEVGRRVQQATGSEIAGAVTAGVTRVAAIPVTAVFGAAGAVGITPGGSDFSDLQARDEEERGAPLEPSTPNIQERRHRLRGRQARQGAQQAQAADALAQTRDQQTRTTHIAAGTNITETMVQARAQAVLRRWALQRGEVAASVDLDEMERAEQTAREELEIERAGIR